MKAMAVSTNSIGVTPPVDSSEASCPEPAIQDIDKRIRALKKKVLLIQMPCSCVHHAFYASNRSSLSGDKKFPLWVGYLKKLANFVNVNELS
ncbi:unnamed protein product [Linum tenue]|uniref:Uncharacterized protein n=1 Tax=Linum tenue TaxID=586396 RepID=A0AAV0LXL9_9ROSI|nr:unnamed protein product [Linum tenue]